MPGSIHSFDIIGDHKVKVLTSPCVVCGKQNSFTLDMGQFMAWQADTHIQEALPELSPEDRETLISGTCGPCFDKLWGEG